MARNIYSFVKIEQPDKRRAVYTVAIGVGAMIMLLLMLILSFIYKGKLPVYIGLSGYASFAISIIGLRRALKMYREMESGGKVIQLSVYVNAAAVILHVLVFLVGCFALVL